MINLSKLNIRREEIEAVKKVLKSGMIAQGPKVAEFEKRFAKFCGVKYAIKAKKTKNMTLVILFL